MTTATAEPSTTGSLFAEVLTDRFSKHEDGLWYPKQHGTPLVRVGVAESGIYSIERRRNERTAWVLLVEGLVNDFDAESFATWADSFALVQI